MLCIAADILTIPMARRNAEKDKTLPRLIFSQIQPLRVRCSTCSFLRTAHESK